MESVTRLIAHDADCPLAHPSGGYIGLCGCVVSRDPRLNDITEGRNGEWCQTSLGGRFYPSDPREEEVFMSDIANGLALDCRYSGQGRVDRFYSVAEHSVHMANYAGNILRWNAAEILATLLHDSAEAYLNDLSRAVKHAVGDGYFNLEAHIHSVVMRKYGLRETEFRVRKIIKDLDRRMVPLEKAAIMRHPQPWAYDQFKPLEDVVIQCWDAPTAKRKFLEAYAGCCKLAGVTQEEIVYE